MLSPIKEHMKLENALSGKVFGDYKIVKIIELACNPISNIFWIILYCTYYK